MTGPPVRPGRCDACDQWVLDLNEHDRKHVEAHRCEDTLRSGDIVRIIGRDSGVRYRVRHVTVETFALPGLITHTVRVAFVQPAELPPRRRGALTVMPACMLQRVYDQAATSCIVDV